MQWIGLTLVCIVSAVLVAWLYLYVTSQTSIAGREIQGYQSQKSKAEQSIAAMQTNLAEITASVEMAKRAKSLGFKEQDTTQFEYMIIPGYAGKPSAELAPKEYVVQVESDAITTEYTQSLWDWMYESYVEPALDR